MADSGFELPPDPDCLPSNPDMQGFAVRLAIFLSHVGMGILLNSVDKSDLHQIRTCFYALFFQLFSIILAMLVATARSELSSGDTLFAMVVFFSPVTMDIFLLIPINLSLGFKRPPTEIFDAAYKVVIYLLGLAGFILILTHPQKESCLDDHSDLLWTGQLFYAIFAMLTLTAHFFRVPGSFVLKYMVQLVSFRNELGDMLGAAIITVPTLVVIMMFSWQIFGIWQVDCVRAEWKAHLGTIWHPYVTRKRLSDWVIWVYILIMNFLFLASIWLGPMTMVIWLGFLVASQLFSKLCPVLYAMCNCSFGVLSEAADNVHPGRYAILEIATYVIWGYTMRVVQIEDHYSLTYGQIVSMLSCLPILWECLKLTFERGHELSEQRLIRAILPMSKKEYRELQRRDTFPEPFWKNKTPTGLITGVTGLSWATCVASHRIPVVSDGMRSTLLSTFPSVRFPEAVDDMTDNVQNTEEADRGVRRPEGEV